MPQITPQPAVQSQESLSESFSTPNLTFEKGPGDQLCANLTVGEQSSCQVQLHGAHVTSWKDAQGRERIFMSPDAVYEAGTPLRGGIPIIFPQFGPGDITSHGFARRSLWRVTGSQSDREHTSMTLVLSTQDISSNYRKEWPYDFKLKQVITLTEQGLESRFEVLNTDSRPLNFTHGFHTYFAVTDIHKTEVFGLTGLTYMDQMQQNSFHVEENNPVRIREHTDRRYEGIPQEITITDRASESEIRIITDNCRDAFLWNPWQDGELGFKDLTPSSYQKFICVEPGNMATACELAPGETFTATQLIRSGPPLSGPLSTRLL